MASAQRQMGRAARPSVVTEGARTARPPRGPCQMGRAARPSVVTEGARIRTASARTVSNGPSGPPKCGHGRRADRTASARTVPNGPSGSPKCGHGRRTDRTASARTVPSRPGGRHNGRVEPLDIRGSRAFDSPRVRVSQWRDGRRVLRSRGGRGARDGGDGAADRRRAGRGDRAVGRATWRGAAPSVRPAPSGSRRCCTWPRASCRGRGASAGLDGRLRRRGRDTIRRALLACWRRRSRWPCCSPSCGACPARRPRSCRPAALRGPRCVVAALMLRRFERGTAPSCSSTAAPRGRGAAAR